MAKRHHHVTPVVAHDAPWLQEMNPLSLLISEMTKMLALSYDIRHPSRYPWLTLLVVHNLSLSTLICLLSDSSSTASLICLLQSCFFSSRSSFFSPSFCFVLTSLWTVEIFFPYFFLSIKKKSLTCFCITCLSVIHPSCYFFSSFLCLGYE